jgi:cytochrome c peroxidase
MKSFGSIVCFGITLLAVGCGGAPAMTTPAYDWKLPAGFPAPVVPADNPMTAEKVELGRHLFYERKLSANYAYACSTCHSPRHAFSDANVVAIGATGHFLPRNVMPLPNAAYANYLMWANPILNTLEEQALVPMFSDAPVELDVAGAPDAIMQRLATDAEYQKLFAAAFPGDKSAFNIGNVVNAIASFERTLISGTSPYDKYQAGDTTAMSADAQAGMALFFTEKYDCYHCHEPPGFTTDFYSTNSPAAPPRDFRNTGLYNIGGTGDYPPDNTGLYAFTQFNNDMGKFRIPTLRNVALTAPYFHDGSAATLDDVLDAYASGGRVITSGPYAGDGSMSIHRDPLVKGIDITPDERRQMLAFFDSLTDTDFLASPAITNPHCTDITPASCPMTVPSYASDVAPILKANCTVCHQAGGEAKELPLDDYASLQMLATQVLDQVAGCAMPPATLTQLSDADRATLLAWLVCGAPNN